MAEANLVLINPDWPVPKHVRSCATTCYGGVSEGSFASLNLGQHVGDSPVAVLENRARLQQAMGYREAAWLEQVHSPVVVKADPKQIIQADASWTDEIGLASIVMTADCLPVLFCDKEGRHVAAAHAGWRGLLSGILEVTIDALPAPASELLAWLGPAIGPEKFEVGSEVRDAFIVYSSMTKSAFKPSVNKGRYLADIYQLARFRLQAKGVASIYGGEFCTVSDERFYSYRRSMVTGRMASLIWLEDLQQ